jgi:hypothetical protein
MNTPGAVIPWQKGETVVRFLPDGRIYVEKVDEVHYPPKRIEARDLETVFGKSYIRCRPCLEDRTGILPKGTVEHLLISKNEEIGHVVVVYREKCVRPFRFWKGPGDITEINVGYPRMLFKFTVFGGAVVSLHVRAVKEDRLKNNTQTYYYPYTNVDPLGKACLGTYRYPQVEELYQISTFPDVFYELPNNADLYNPHHGGGIPLKKLLAANENREFDDSLLAACPDENYEKFVKADLDEAL